MFCSKCGQKIEENSQFCSNCGNKLSIDNKQSSESNKIRKITIAIISLFIAVSYTFFTVIDYLEWEDIKKNYHKQYVYSDNGILQYDIDTGTIYVETMLDITENEIKKDIPDNKTILMYCHKDDPTTCIYINLNDSSYQKYETFFLEPIFPAIFFLLGIGCLQSLRNIDKVKKWYANICLTSIGLVFMSVVFLGTQVVSIKNYSKLEEQQNVATATAYSEIYKSTGTEPRYRQASYYYVNGTKYIYVNETYERGLAEQNYGNTIKIYYDEENPNNAVKVDQPISLSLVVCGMFLFIIGILPFIFKKQLKQRISNNLERYGHLLTFK